MAPGNVFQLAWRQHTHGMAKEAAVTTDIVGTLIACFTTITTAITITFTTSLKRSTIKPLSWHLSQTNLASICQVLVFLILDYFQRRDQIVPLTTATVKLSSDSKPQGTHQKVQRFLLNKAAFPQILTSLHIIRQTLNCLPIQLIGITCPGPQFEISRIQ